MLKNLNQSDIDYIKEIYLEKSLSWDDRMQLLMKKFNKSERTIRKWMIKLGVKERKEVVPEQLEIAKLKQHDAGKKRFIISWAQNNTEINKKLLRNIECYSRFIDAEILIIAGRYSNRLETLKKDTKESWAEEILPYLDANRHYIHPHLCVLSDIKISATAVNPLTSLESITGEESSIFGHPRMHLKTLPVLEGQRMKTMCTTGCITIPNFTNSKLGSVGLHHYTPGFCIVEIRDSDIFHLRQVTSTKNGDFVDLFYKVSNEKVTKIETMDALIMGDIHLSEVNEDVVDTTFNVLCKKLIPKNIILHDLIDSSSISHHNLNNPFKLHRQEIEGKNSLEDEINQMLNWLEKIKNYNVVVVKSNHHDHVDKFLETTDWRKMTTLKNAIPYMSLALEILNNKAPNGIIAHLIQKKFPNFKCLGDNDSFKVKGIELAVHGHIGISGSRANIQQYRKLNTRMCVAHSHVACRLDGVSSVGTSSKLRMYNIGPSAWSNCHVSINEFGKMQHIFFIKNKNGKYEFTTFE